MMKLDENKGIHSLDKININGKFQSTPFHICRDISVWTKAVI